MTFQTRYPNDVSQTDKENTWFLLKNIKIDDWENLAYCEIDGEMKPNIFTVSNFKFNLPDVCLIKQILVYHNFHRENTHNPIEMDPPNIRINVGDKTFEQNSHVQASIESVERLIIFNDEHIGDISPNDINDNFSIDVIFPKNSSEGIGKLYFDFINVKVEYEEKHYVISSGETNSHYPFKDEPIKLAIGETFRYTVNFRNQNGIGTDKQEVHISIPDGFKVEDYFFKPGKQNKLDDELDLSDLKDEFDEENNIWYPSVRGKGLSRIRLIIKCVKEGKYILNSFNQYAGSTSNFHVEVYGKDFESPPNLFDKAINIWNEELDGDEEFQLINQNLVINVEKISMEFKKPQEKVDNLKEYCIKWVKRDLKPKTKFKALDNVSFSVYKGERVGIIGFNGAGKSTILKILSGVLKPTSGNIQTYGTVAPLLELGAGFDHNYSGRENVFLNGAILGYSREFLESKFEEILEFSELGDFIDIPIKNYSSGMVAKLGFSVATIVEPDVLILDEVLSVGDVKFQKKSGDKLKSMMGSGVTVLLVSHATDSIRDLCTRAIWLDEGKLVMDGDVDYVCDAYIEAAQKASEEQLSGLDLR